MNILIVNDDSIDSPGIALLAQAAGEFGRVLLIVNDDSIDSPGIALLAQAAGEFGRVWVVAPDAQCSAMSQKVTIRGGLTAKPVENFPANIDSPGIALLAQAAGEFGRVWVVAPDAQCSAMSQKVTIRGGLTAKPVENFPAKVEGAYRVTGSPADCVRVALDCLLEERPDYVFSGINDGYNVGYDIAYSGTVGAAMEAVMHGVPAIAFSNA